MLPQTIRRRALWCSAVVSRSDRVACLVRRPPSTGRISFPAASTPRAVSMSSHTVSGSGGADVGRDGAAPGRLSWFPPLGQGAAGVEGVHALALFFA